MTQQCAPSTNSQNGARVSSLSWQEQLRTAISTSQELRDLGFSCAPDIEKRFPILIPHYYLGLANARDPQDPIALMAVPQAEEMILSPAGLRDPIGDLEHNRAARLTHRYGDRALLHVTNLCPMVCRFCFRKNLLSEREEDLYAGDFVGAVEYLKQHREIEELILSGGDPWMLSDGRLAALLRQIFSEVKHLKRLRFHTRMVVTLPARVTDALVAAICENVPEGVRVFVVSHFNHPREISPEAIAALDRLRAAGFVLLNQNVLLKGVNNSVEVLRALYQELGNAGVLPYYLHHADQVAGAEHFRTSLAEGRAIWRALRGTLPGYLLPEYVLEIPGGGGKVPVGESTVREVSAGEYLVKDRFGESITYRESQAGYLQ